MNTPHDLLLPHTAAIDALRDVGALFYDKGWGYGTSGNYSVVLSRNPLRLLITASGKDKRNLSRADFTIVDCDGKSVDPALPAPSAETLLHVTAAHYGGAGAVLHTHSVWATLLSEHYLAQKCVTISGYEMLKGLSGITTHKTTKRLRVYENTQQITDLAEAVSLELSDQTAPLTHGFLMSGHGLYAWGRDLDEARRHIEIIEFLLEVTAHKGT